VTAACRYCSPLDTFLCTSGHHHPIQYARHRPSCSTSDSISRFDATNAAWSSGLKTIRLLVNAFDGNKRWKVACHQVQYGRDHENYRRDSKLYEEEAECIGPVSERPVRSTRGLSCLIHQLVYPVTTPQLSLPIVRVASWRTWILRYF